jgi:hypothetical protein
VFQELNTWWPDKYMYESSVTSVVLNLRLVIGGLCAGNVLLLRNNLNVSTDLAEISLSELLSLIAERLLDVNSNTEV